MRTPVDASFQGNPSENGSIQSVRRSSQDLNRKPGICVQVSEGKGVNPQLYRRSPFSLAGPPLGHFMAVANRLGAICFLTLVGSHRLPLARVSASAQTRDASRGLWHIWHLLKRAVLSPMDRFLFLSRVQALLFHPYNNSSSPLINRFFFFMWTKLHAEPPRDTDRWQLTTRKAIVSLSSWG